MSAFGYKQTFQGVSQNVRFTPESRHSDVPNGWDTESGLSMSALPPKADIGEGIAGCPLMTRSGHSRRWMGGETNAYQECPVSVRWTIRRPTGIWFGYRISSIIVADQIP